MIQCPSFRGPNQPCSTATSGRVLPITERSVVPMIPATRPAINMLIKARAARLYPRRTSQNTANPIAGINSPPLAEPLRMWAQACKASEAMKARCARSQSSPHKRTPNRIDPKRAHKPHPPGNEPRPRVSVTGPVTGGGLLSEAVVRLESTPIG